MSGHRNFIPLTAVTDNRRHLPVTPVARAPKGFGEDAARSAWHRGFRSGVVAAIGGLCVLVVVGWMLLLALGWGWL